jgi:hypothetical protein
LVAHIYNKLKIKIMSDVRPELDKVIQELESKGVTFNTPKEELQRRGLGDVVESTLTKFGITQERYKSFFGLQECNCTKRKKWLNGFLSWNTKN